MHEPVMALWFRAPPAGKRKQRYRVLLWRAKPRAFDARGNMLLGGYLSGRGEVIVGVYARSLPRVRGRSTAYSLANR